MNISKAEQRVLHLLAQGGAIRHERNEDGKLTKVTCITRDGHGFPGLTLALFRKLKRRGFISSRNGRPYRITRHGLACVRARPDNR